MAMTKENHQSMNQYLSTTALIAALLGASACQSTDDDPDDQDDQDELQALLRDGPLSHVPSAALSAALAPAPEDAGPGIASDAPVGSWSFNDCVSFQTQLGDSSEFGNTAFRSVGVNCTDGVEGLAVAIAAREDIVYVPDQPNFTFEEGVTVAGWFNPTTTGGTKTLFRKRDKDTSSFALLLNGGRFQFVVSLGEERAISVSSPQRAKAGVFQHVAGTYDGDTLRLYVDGVEVNQFAVPGEIPPGPGPVLMGNDGSERRFSGIIDDAIFATHALDPDEVLELLCAPHRPTMEFSPEIISETPPGVPATIDVTVTNSRPDFCGPLTFQLQTFSSQGLLIDPPEGSPVESEPVPSGESTHFTITATADDTATPGDVLFVDFFVEEFTTGFFEFGTVFFEVGEPTSGCRVSTARELMIRNLSVVDDPVRTVFDPASDDPRNGVWTFKHLIENMAPTPEDAPAMVEAVIGSFIAPQTVNGFTVEARPGMASFLDSWPRTQDGALDLARAPLQLQAIVNRFDLRNLAAGDAGEGRFVFAFMESGFPLQATLIIEYKLPAASEADVFGWAEAFHALGELPFGEEYNAALQVVTDRFAGRGARPGTINGSALNALRTNEIAFGGVWELREFNLSPVSGLLEPTPVALTPDGSFNFSDTLAAFIEANQADIIAERHVVPRDFDGAPFQGGAVFNELTTWFAPGVDSEARHHFGLNTCNGCHSSEETNTAFLQIEPRFEGSEAGLSGFLTGTTVSDPETGDPRTFNDLARRNADLKAIVCAEPAARSNSWKTTLRKGISRVH
jgi:hypothetical protein